MKYLSALKEKNPPNEEIKKPQNPYHDVLQKVQKGVFTVFAVLEGGTSQQKTGSKIIEHEQAKAKGYGCGLCGHRIYRAVQAWEMTNLPGTSNYQNEYTPVIHWQCEGCGAVFEIIGGMKGPQPIN